VSLLRRLLKALLEPVTRPVALARDLVTAHPVLVLAFLVAMAAVVVATIRGSRLAALGLIPMSLVWLVINRPVEGPTLLVLSWSHGITVADLLSVAGLGLAGWRLTLAAVAVLR
jgi:hypothetical protein